MLLYVAGPYSGDVEQNISKARAIAVELWKKDHSVICPHMNSAHMEGDGIEWETFMQGDYQMIARCDGLVMVPGWENSKGATLEKQYAESLGIPVWFAPDLPELHPVEKRCPQQVKAFAETVGQMYRLHLSKNSDYSPANILGAGEIGIVTRLWDKIARLMNLVGFRMEISGCTFEAPKTPKHEAIDDTFIDAANYGVIGLLFRRGLWGK